MYGISSFNLIPVRATDSDKSEMVTQLLFGDQYSISEESENGKWVKIKIIEDQYEGWIDKKLHTENLLPHSENTNHLCSDIVTYLESESSKKIIFFGSYLPCFDGENVYINSNRFCYKGNSEKFKKEMNPDNLIGKAKNFIGTPYLWGGKSPAGIDCSGLVQIVFRSCGYTLLRDAWQQASMGIEVDSLRKARSGDLAFFSNDAGRVTHVGILLNNESIIHAHGEVRIDAINETGIINSTTGLYSHKLSGIRNIIGQT